MFAAAFKKLIYWGLWCAGRAIGSGCAFLGTAVPVAVSVAHGGNGFAQVGGHLGHLAGGDAKLRHGVGDIQRNGINRTDVAVDFFRSGRLLFSSVGDYADHVGGLQALAGSALLGLVAGAYPAWQAARVEVLDVLRLRL